MQILIMKTVQEGSANAAMRDLCKTQDYEALDWSFSLGGDLDLPSAGFDFVVGGDE